MSDTMEAFERAPVPKAVLKNAIPAMAAMLMVLIYNLADTFFIGQTHNDILVAADLLSTALVAGLYLWTSRRMMAASAEKKSGSAALF